MILHAGGTDLPLVLDRTSPIPLYHQLFEQLATGIARGELKPGDTLEREDLLSRCLDISRPTLRRALSELAAAGLITRSRGQGTVVAGPPAVGLRLAESSLREHLTVEGPAKLRVMRFEPDHLDSQVAGELGLGKRGRLVYLEQLLVVPGRVVSISREWLPASLVNPALHDLTTVPFRRILAEVGHAAVAERRTFESRQPDSLERAALNLTPADQVFTVRGVAFDREGTPVQLTSRTYLNELDEHEGLRAAG